MGSPSTNRHSVNWNSLFPIYATDSHCPKILEMPWLFLSVKASSEIHNSTECLFTLRAWWTLGIEGMQCSCASTTEVLWVRRKAERQQLVLEQQSEAVMRLLHYRWRSHKGEDRWLEEKGESGTQERKVWGEGLKDSIICVRRTQWKG